MCGSNIQPSNTWILRQLDNKCLDHEINKIKIRKQQEKQGCRVVKSSVQWRDFFVNLPKYHSKKQFGCDKHLRLTPFNQFTMHELIIPTYILPKKRKGYIYFKYYIIINGKRDHLKSWKDAQTCLLYFSSLPCWFFVKHAFNTFACKLSTSIDPGASCNMNSASNRAWSFYQ